ncbi:MAG: YkgJ family cysteine cluster protein [Halorhabdus sp.]
MDLEAERAAVRALDVDALADAIETIGFECTRCGKCCRGIDEDHTATVFPEEVRTIQREGEHDWPEVARPMPFGLTEADDGTKTGETFEWALQTDACGDCTFYDAESGACSIYDNRPLLCQTYPFSLSVDDGSAAESMGSVVDREGAVQAHECEGLGRDISREDAEELAATLKERALREVAEAREVRDAYEPLDVDGVVVHDSEGAKRPDGSPVQRDSS